ncbi:alpha/beta hydrolase [Alkalispirochaeta americana]|uniref:alpha/beta hydrolase n=1 Tax=Alkalispirochaeta americana TaxID=159291 RepID=UPI0013566081|nr:dienelactone hydrolase family protein [Alkalispirochaeta americana]
MITEGPGPGKAAAALILLHGRGSGAQQILGLGRTIVHSLGRRDLLLLAPHAMRSTWYLPRFAELKDPLDPWLVSARQAVDALITKMTAGGIAREKIFLLGFSQGACLVADRALRIPQRYGGLFILSGASLPPANREEDEPENPAANMEGTPVCIGCSQEDPHIPLARLRATEEALRKASASVETLVYPGAGHTVTPEEMSLVQEILTRGIVS